MKHTHGKKKEHDHHHSSSQKTSGEKSCSCDHSTKGTSGDKSTKGCSSSGSKWSALDTNLSHPVFWDDDNQEAVQASNMAQASYETIVIKDSADVEVHTTDTQAAVALQAALQAAISLVVSITVADSATAEKVTQELLQKANFKQTNVQRTIVENSRNVKVTTTDTDLAISIQILLQVLLALVVELDIL